MRADHKFRAKKRGSNIIKCIKCDFEIRPGTEFKNYLKNRTPSCMTQLEKAVKRSVKHDEN